MVSVRALLSLLLLAGISGCTAEFRTLLPNGEPAPQPEVVTLMDEKVIKLRPDRFTRDDVIYIAEDGVAKFDLRVPGEAIAVGLQVTGSLEGAFQAIEWRDGNEKLLVDSLPNVRTAINGMVTNEGNVDDYWRCAGCANPTSLQPLTFTALAPNNPKGKFSPGEHSFIVRGQSWETVALGANYFIIQTGAAPATGYARVSAFAKVTPSLPETGVVDLNLHYTNAQAWKASTAESNPNIRDMLETLSGILSGAGLRIGTVRHFDVDTDFAMLGDTGIPSADSDMFAMRREGSELPGLNVFFVGEFVGEGGLFGIASGIPGAFYNGTESAGVSVALDMHVRGGLLDPDSVAHTVAHELGHELGLFHTVEYSGSTDPLEDTSETCEWLMFASPFCEDGSDPGARISREQGKVIRRNMHVYHEAEEGVDL